MAALLSGLKAEHRVPDNQMWTHVGMALKVASGLENANRYLDHWIQWSESVSTSHDRSAQRCRRDWRHFRSAQDPRPVYGASALRRWVQEDSGGGSGEVASADSFEKDLREAKYSPPSADAHLALVHPVAYLKEILRDAFGHQQDDHWEDSWWLTLS